ncbi:MAG: Sodium/proton antiporter [Candidatus Woesebacteria bacterium GW2011_GWB1_45_5]|uniref:Sodium/proton antiporter n=1 Tax=Candidatus Woesebacteria bacterium GW2011_GWB1_45_5 TaxID=1618581 RepID=A0A0G1MP44_9BACT|nr:MAG: Sodium/proton antiporter [Candidatus Woesebacteria bacterium GW2011_GWB1_45_5]
MVAMEPVSGPRFPASSLTVFRIDKTFFFGQNRHMVDSPKASLLERFVPALLVMSVALAFVVGILWQKVSTLEKGGSPAVANNAAGNVDAVPDGKLTEDQAKKVPAISGEDHIRGSKDAEIIVIEYSDFECPFCERFHPTMQQALKEYGDKIAWVYRQFPLTSIHPRALPAANASECVANLAGNNAFWKFADTVFGNQEKYLTDAGLSEAAVASGVKKADFSSCYSAKKFESTVTSQQTGGESAGITGTPGSFVMNKEGEAWLVPGAVSFESLKATIDEALN